MSGDYVPPITPNWVCASVGGCNPAPIVTTGVVVMIFVLALSVLVTFGLFLVFGPAFADEQKYWDEVDAAAAAAAAAAVDARRDAVES